MPAQQESLANLQEQLTLADSQLAALGITRIITSTEDGLASLEQEIDFYQDFHPTHPGPRPHIEAGGMDHQDYEAEAWEYSHADEIRDENVARLERIFQLTEASLRNLYDDNAAVIAGDDETVRQYATAERKRIQAEIDQRNHAYAE